MQLLAVELEPRHAVKGTGGEPAEIFRRLIVAEMIRSVVAGEQHASLRLPIEADRIAQPRSKRLPARLAAALAQDKHSAAPVIERIARAQILVATVALDAQAHVHPPIRPHAHGAAVMPA